MTRRVALVLLMTVVAGPAMNWPCLIACSRPDPVVADEACHRSTAAGPQVTGIPDCRNQLPELSAFVRPAPANASMIDQRSGEPMVRVSSGPSWSTPLAAAGAGPPGCRRLTPLRI